ncbi:DMT family transporter [Actinokineospora terrae]|uniref:Permease of the drug/metabolite transporter (DMT) superfamily n=1 Tax=Actinokineospora terrae TaxID=155974 RepID=A0A1H9VWH6_9PSEU|nr:DMT family transporter [Actinokineospora terrae]SES26015.1 Permease of the drug/metabolite transporter (DMT) superfamily [Actinokineospora terrae]
MDRRAGWAAGVSAVLWASAFVVIRDAAPHFSAGALAQGRLVSGALALVLFLVVQREGLPGRGAWPGIIGSGVLWFGGYMVILNWGEKLVDAGTAAMVVNIGPILIAVLGGWLLQEGFPPRLVAGMAISFAGAIVVGVSTSQSGTASVLGIVLCLGAAISYAGGVVLQKPALRHGSALQVTTFGCVIGAVATLPFSGQLVDGLQTAPTSSIVGMVYLGLFPTALAFYTWAYALSRTTAGRMGATTYVVPALVLLMSWLFLGEVPTALTLAGGALCLAGVAVARSKPRADRSPVRLTRTRPDGDVI